MNARPCVGAALFLLAAIAGAADDPPLDAKRLRDRVREYRQAHELAIVRELVELLAIPNVASDRDNIARNARLLTGALRRRGFQTALLETPGASPAVYGELAAPGASRTVVFYAHYDGQPVKTAEWSGDPWKPLLRDGPLEEGGRPIGWDGLRAPLDPEWRLYGRSASDDKGPIVGLLTALDALRSSGVPLSVNVKVFLEGDEEAGSPRLRELLAGSAQRLRADLWLLLDGPVHPSRKMQLYFGARGVTDLELTVYGPVRRLHSGHYGNWAPNPVADLTRLLSGMRDTEGKILVAGFSEDVRPLTESERRAVAQAPHTDEALARELALGRTEGEGARLLDRILLPALNLRGISAGGVGSDATNSIPTEATASIDFRLVPDQTPERVRARIEDHVTRQGFRILHDAPTPQERRGSPRVARLVWGPGYPGARTSLDLPVSLAVTRVVQESQDGVVIRLPTLGGSVPMHLFADLGAPVIGVPIVNHDNNQHAANENLRLQNLWDGIEVYAAILARLGRAWAETGH